MVVTLVKKEGKLYPAYDSDKEKLSKFGDGEMLSFTVKKQRNVQHHKKLFALLRLALHNLPEAKEKEANNYGFSFKSEEDLLFYVKMKLGYWKERIILDGKVVITTDSISFSKMDQYEFEDFYNKAVDVVINLLGADRELIERELLGFM